MNLVIDLGQSGVRIKREGEISTKSFGKTSTKSTLETLDSVFREIPGAHYENTYLSLTGLNGKVKNPEGIGELCNQYFNSKNVAILDDGFAAYYGALGKRNGVVLTIGSGVVAISGNNGEFAHTDGRGAIFGDFGSGYWLGQTGLRRAVSTLDGRDDAHELVDLLRDELIKLESIENKVGAEASLLCIESAKTITLGAEQGLDSALQILEKGSELLATTVTSAWTKVKNSDLEPPHVVLTGGLTRSSLYVRLIQEHISDLIECIFVKAEADHLIGAEEAALAYPDGMGDLMKWVHFK